MSSTVQVSTNYLIYRRVCDTLFSSGMFRKPCRAHKVNGSWTPTMIAGIKLRKKQQLLLPQNQGFITCWTSNIIVDFDIFPTLHNFPKYLILVCTYTQKEMPISIPLESITYLTIPSNHQTIYVIAFFVRSDKLKVNHYYRVFVISNNEHVDIY